MAWELSLLRQDWEFIIAFSSLTNVSRNKVFPLLFEAQQESLSDTRQIICRKEMFERSYVKITTPMGMFIV